MRRKLTLTLAGILAITGVGCTSPQPIYDGEGRIISYEERFDSKKTLGAALQGVGVIARVGGLVRRISLESHILGAAVGLIGRDIGQNQSVQSYQNQNNGIYMASFILLKAAKNHPELQDFDVEKLQAYENIFCFEQSEIYFYNNYKRERIFVFDRGNDGNIEGFLIVKGKNLENLEIVNDEYKSFILRNKEPPLQLMVNIGR